MDGVETRDRGVRERVRAMGSEWGRRVKGRLLGGIRVALCEPPWACETQQVKQGGGGVSCFPFHRP